MLYNLREYHRPADIDEAIQLLHRSHVRTVALAGGTQLVGESRPEVEAVVDLGGLGLDFVEREGNTLRLGAMLRLQTIVDDLGDVADGLLSDTAYRMAGWHVRNAATLGGMLAGGDIHSPLSVALTALQAQVRLHGVKKALHWAELAQEVARQGLKEKLITSVMITLPGGEVGAAYEQVGRTPADHPIVCAAAMVCRSGGGQVDMHLAVGGLLRDVILIEQVRGASDSAAGVDQIVASIIDAAPPDADYLDDFLGSADYRRHLAPVLARRALLTALDRA